MDIYWHLWNLVPGITGQRLRRIVKHFKNPKDAWRKATLSDLLLLRIPEETAQAALRTKQHLSVDKELESLSAYGIVLISCVSERFPPLLKEIYNPPALLYTCGLELRMDGEACAVVGTRMPSAYGLSMAEYFSETLAENAITVVSGFAKGIDQKAHEATLKSGGYTIAVLGSGLFHIAPANNKSLMEATLAGGTFISELPPDTPPQPYFFPKRNRIISGLCRGTLIVEARRRSGALITAQLALEQNREVFAIPGNLGNPCSEGTNELIQQGAAHVALSPMDIVEELKRPKYMKTPRLLDLNNDEQKIIKCLSGGPLHVDEIVRSINATPAEIGALLTTLILKGAVTETGPQIYSMAVDTR